MKGLSLINRESIDTIRTAVWELEKAGYITRQQNRDGKGKMADMVYTIYEQPQPRPEAEDKEQPGLENPVLENPTSDNPTSENPVSENPTQLNKDIQTKDPLTTDPSSTHSIPILSPTPLLRRAGWHSRRNGSERKRMRHSVDFLPVDMGQPRKGIVPNLREVRAFATTSPLLSRSAPC